jgi:Protein of unknown function (DUF1566)
MKRSQGFRWVLSLGLIALGMVVFMASAAGAPKSAGPYYATPSWDQTLPSDNRFIVLSNMDGNAVLDRETGLVWEKSPSPTLSTDWFNAQVRCNTLRMGGRLGWRLPTLQELASLVDPSIPFPNLRLPADHPFSNVQPGFYWSATTFAALASVWWGVNFSSGDVGIDDGNSNFVWCVRGGQGPDAQ